jgi:hypothetical protein
MGPIDCFGMSVASYLSMLHDIPKEPRSHLNKGGILKAPRSDFSVVYMNRNFDMTWLRCLVTGLSPRRPRFKAWSVYMESAMDWVPMGHVSECNVIFPIHYQSTIVLYAFIFHWHFVISAVEAPMMVGQEVGCCRTLFMAFLMLVLDCVSAIGVNFVRVVL